MEFKVVNDIIEHEITLIQSFNSVLAKYEKTEAIPLTNSREPSLKIPKFK
jgi:hypothetical protein